MKHSGDTIALIGSGDRRNLRHEVEVEKLNELQLDLTGGGSRLEKRGDSEKTVKALKGTGVNWGLDKSSDECEESRRLDRRAVERLEKVKEELHDVSFVVFSGLVVVYIRSYSVLGKRETCWEDVATRLLV